MSKEIKSESEKKKEDWMNSKWRPMMGWSYMLTCIADFVIFPVLWSVLQSISKGQVNMQWQPITLQGAGLYHIAMGAVLGIAAYGRTQEKLGGANNGGIALPPNAGTTYIPPNSNTQTNINLGNPGPAPGGFGGGGGGGYNNPASSSGFGGNNGFGNNSGFSNNSGFGGSSQVVTGFGGKPGPMQPPDPVI